MNAVIRGLCLILLLTRGLCAAEPRLFGRGPEGLRTAVQTLISLQDQGYPTMLSPVRKFADPDASQNLVIVVGDAVTGGTSEIRAFLAAGGCVLMVSEDPAAVDFYRSLGLKGNRQMVQGGVGRGWATAMIDGTFLSNARLASEPGVKALRGALDWFREVAPVKWIRLVNRVRYQINPTEEPSYTAPEYVEDLEAPRFTDSNEWRYGYHYTAGRARQIFKDTEYSPDVQKSFVRVKAFDTFVDGRFGVRNPELQPMTVPGSAAPDCAQYVGKVDSEEAFRGGEPIVIPSLGPEAVLLGFEVRTLVGDEWRRQGLVHEGDESSPPSGWEYREVEEEEGAGLFFQGRTRTVRRLVPRARPGGDGPGAVEEVGTMGDVFEWSAKCRWKRDALNNWTLYLPHPDEVPPPDRDELGDGLRFTLKYQVAWKPSPYLVSASRNFTEVAIPDTLMVRDATRRMAGWAEAIPATEGRELGLLLHDERRPGEPYFPATLSALDAGGDMKYRDFISVLSDFFTAEFRDEAIDLIDEYDSFTEAMLFHRAGVCRHRARTGFLVASYFGVPTRLVVSSDHAFLEVAVPVAEGLQWIQVHLGGGESATAMVHFIRPPMKPPGSGSLDVGVVVSLVGLIAAGFGGVACAAWFLLRLLRVHRARGLLRRLAGSDTGDEPRLALLRAELACGNYRSVALTALAAVLCEAARRHAPHAHGLTATDAAAAIRHLADAGRMPDPAGWKHILETFQRLLDDHTIHVRRGEFRSLGETVRRLEAA